MRGPHGCARLLLHRRSDRYNLCRTSGITRETNPCGEQPADCPYDVCNLGSINIGAYVKDGRHSTGLRWPNGHFPTSRCRFLDNISDVNKYPLPEIDAAVEENCVASVRRDGFCRRIGELGYSYNTEEGVEFRPQAVSCSLTSSRKRESERLLTSADRSPSGPAPSGVRTQWLARGPAGERIRPMQMLRNCNVNTVAPTGTISIIAGCSSGIEPFLPLRS
jgi:ribonucleoside-diphosphate reductase alpha chain